MSYNLEATAAAAPNSFKGPDGLLNFDAVFKLQTQVESMIQKAIDAGKDVKVVGYYVVNAKAKHIKYSALLEKKDDLKYLTRRAINIATRKRIMPASAAKIKIVMTLVEGKDVPAAFKAKIKEAVSAIIQHLKKLVKAKATLTKKKGKVRDDSNASFNASIEHLRAILINGGIKEDAIVETTGMFGKSVLVKLSSEYVVSIGKADLTRFAAAKKAAKAASV
jgi:hypothetical protein